MSGVASIPYVKIVGSVEDIKGLDDRQTRPRVAFFPSLTDLDKEQVLRKLGFSEEALQRIYAHFRGGQSEVLRGLDYCGALKLHRVGFSKNGDPRPKFYLVIEEAKNNGGISQFFHGYNRRGIPRAITTYDLTFRINFEPAEALSGLSHPCHKYTQTTSKLGFWTASKPRE